MVSILTNPYTKLKIPKAQQNTMQALAVDICSKSKIKYNSEIRAYFNRINKIQFNTLAALIERSITKYKPFENKFKVSAVINRKISANQLITKTRGLKNNESILGFNANKNLVYLTLINGRPAVFGDIDQGLNSLVKITTNTLALKRWTIITSDEQFGDHQIHLNSKKELICKYHYDDCIAIELIKHQKLEPGEYRFLSDSADDQNIDLDAPSLILGSITDNSLKDRKYKYKEYADADEQVNFIYNLIEQLIKPMIWAIPNYKDFIDEHQDEINEIFKETTTTLNYQDKRKIINKIAMLIEENINFESDYVILADTDAVFEHLTISANNSTLSDHEIDKLIDEMIKTNKLKCDREDLKWAITGSQWQEVIDLLCENYGTVDKVNKRIKELIYNSSIYIAIPPLILSDFVNTEMKPCYLTNSKPGDYLNNRLMADMYKHDAYLVNALSFPKYGMVGTKDYPLYNTEITRGYGSVLLELKEIIKERSTICLGDSLDYLISPVSDSFADFNIYNFIGILVLYPTDNLDEILLDRRIDEFMKVLDNIMSSKSLDYGLDMNYLLNHVYAYTDSYFEVQIKGDLMLTERDIKAIYVSDAEDALVVSTVLKEESLDIPLKYSQSFNYRQTKTTVPLAERQGKRK